MNNLLEITHIGQLLGLDPSEKDEGSYHEVRCLGTWFHCDVEQWREVFLKACFLCGEKLTIDLRIDNSEIWKIRMYGFRSVVGLFSANYRFLHQGFHVVERQNVEEKIVRFIAIRMPRLMWDGKTALNDYEDGVVVALPLTHPQFDSYWKNSRTEERMERERELLRSFSCWQFAPLMYCQTCRRIHDGGHRWMVVRELGWKEVPVRIVRYGRDKHCREVERRGIEVEEYDKELKRSK